MSHLSTQSLDDELTVVEAIKYLGCSVPQLYKLVRLKWLRPIQFANSYTRATAKPNQYTFYRYQLELVCWDMAYALSIFELLFIQASQKKGEAVAKKKGLPLRVVEIVRSSEIFKQLAIAVMQYGRYRSSLRQEINNGQYTYTNDGFTSEALRRVLDRNVLDPRRDSAILSEISSFEDVSRRHVNDVPPSRHIFGQKGAAHCLSRLLVQQTQTQTGIYPLPRMSQSESLRQPRPIAQQYQKPLLRQAREARKREKAASSASDSSPQPQDE